MKKLGAAFIFAFALLGATCSASAVEIEGLPIKLGDTVEEVKAALNTDMEPEDANVALPTAAKKTQIRLKTKGIWAFFQNGKAYSIRLDLPFSGNIGGVKLGDSMAKIVKTFGKPVKESRIGTTTSYLYYFSDVVTTKFVFNNDGELETIFFIK